MKKTRIKLITTSLFLLTLCVALFETGCKKDDVSQSILNGKWILIALGDDSTNEFIFEPDSEPKSSYVEFNNGEMVAHSVSNYLNGKSYILKKGNRIIFTTSGVETLAGGDTEWGQQFLHRIGKIYEFAINEDELKLYYENQKFMQLVKETD